MSKPETTTAPTPTQIKSWLSKEAEAKAYYEDEMHHLAIGTLNYIEDLEEQCRKKQ